MSDWNPAPKWDQSNAWGPPFVAIAMDGDVKGHKRCATYDEAWRWLVEQRSPGMILEVATELAIGHGNARGSYAPKKELDEPDSFTLRQHTL